MFVAAEELGAETVSLDSIKIGEVVRRVQWAITISDLSMSKK